jgi:ABC-2 type transport system ATP-binding protein
MIGLKTAIGGILPQPLGRAWVVLAPPLGHIIGKAVFLMSLLPDHAIAVSGLTKTYKASGKSPAKQALKGIDLAIKRGSMFALLGPNGAGKSTFINILAGLVIKSQGTVKVWDLDLDLAPRAVRSAIGIVPQELNIDPFFTPREILDINAGLYGVPKAERRTQALLEALGLADKAEAYARTLSGGMRRRLMVAKAMVHNPPILILDEPTAGVDVELRQQLWTQVKALNAQGITIVLTTHYLEEAQELCDTIAIIDQGRLVTAEPKEKLLKRLDSKTLYISPTQALTSIPAELARWNGALSADGRLILRFAPSQTQLGEILAALTQAGITVGDLTTQESDLQDIFLQLTGSMAQKIA